MLTSGHAIDWSSVVEDNRDWIGRVVAARTGTQDVVDDVIQEVGLAGGPVPARRAPKKSLPGCVRSWSANVP